MESDIICTGLLTSSDFTEFILECTFLQQEREVFFLGEILPACIITTAKEREPLIHIAPFDTTIPYVQYTFGRIFHRDFELRWQSEENHLHVIYAGIERDIPRLKPEMRLIKQPLAKKYYLFGKRLSAQRLKEIGKPARPGDFAETRIPRLLHYPEAVSGQGEYIQVVVQEYLDPETQAVAFYRFRQLLPEGQIDESI
jgi:hypothetical protein